MQTVYCAHSLLWSLHKELTVQAEHNMLPTKLSQSGRYVHCHSKYYFLVVTSTLHAKISTDVHWEIRDGTNLQDIVVGHPPTQNPISV